MNISQGSSKIIFQKFVQGNCLELDLAKFNQQAHLLLPCLNDIISLPSVNHIRLFYPITDYQSNQKNSSPIICAQNLYLIIKGVAEQLQNNHSKHLRSIKIQNIPQISQCLDMISSGIYKSKYLKQLSITNCSLNDSNLQTIKLALSQNISLTSIDFSHNLLAQSGQFIVQILSKHAQRKTELLSLYEKRKRTPQFDISSTGIYKVNLQGNRLSANMIDQIIKYLQSDRWVKSINLKNNQLQEPEINKFIALLEQNETLINLDLRNNPGINKKCAKKIFNKLKENLQKLKNKNNFLVKQPQKSSPTHHSQQKPKDNQNKANDNQQSLFTKFSKKAQTSQTKRNNKNITTYSKSKRHSLYLDKQSPKIFPHEALQKDCPKCFELRKKLSQTQQRCMKMQIQALKAEKQKLELEIEIKKLKSFIEKNKDLSLIGMSINKIAIENPPQLNTLNSNVSTSFNKILGPQNDDELISRIEVLVTQLTRIMQTVQHFQNTQNTIEHPFSNVNSFSKTISLYERPRQLMQIQQQILQDQALHLQQFGDQSINLGQTVLGAQQSILKAAKNEIIEQK